MAEKVAPAKVMLMLAVALRLVERPFAEDQAGVRERAEREAEIRSAVGEDQGRGAGDGEGIRGGYVSSH